MAFIGPYQIYTIDGAEIVDRVDDWAQLGTSVNNAAATAEVNAAAAAKIYADAEVAVDRGRLNLIEAKNTTQDGRLDGAEAKNAEQDTTLGSHGTRLTAAEAKNTTQDGRLTSIETKNTAQDGRLDVVEGDALRQRAALTTEDLDTVTTIGTYGREFGGGATTALHYPVASRGVLTVTAMPGGGVAQSYYASFLNQTFTREKFGGVWSAWDSAAVSRGVLASGTNLNTLTGPEHVGTYSLLTTSTYPNAPTFTGTAVLEVHRGSGNTLSVVQRLTFGAAMLWREAVDAAAGTWSVWEQVETVSRANSTNAVQDGRLTSAEAKNTEQDNRLNYMDTKNDAQDGRLTSAEAKNTEQDGRLNSVEAKNVTQDDRLDIFDTRTTDHGIRLNNVEAVNTGQDNRLDFIDQVLPKVSNIALDTDGIPFFSPGSTAVHVIPDGDGEPYFITFMSASADADGTPYF